ncbi:hypothetical protein A0H81_13043 [Grifola frondosa]|uniref:Uncharacterized protein n=1 Tax=Grifola frondosa TaxID=5627 RepID=A0A1C7LSW5_GRIFR|nr:hypothetical protein A0H81_13043 [Grifola frondosa]
MCHHLPPAPRRRGIMELRLRGVWGMPPLREFFADISIGRLMPTPPIPLRSSHLQPACVFLPQEIGWLDALLLSWGYYDDPKVFVQHFEQDYEQVRGHPAARATWVQGKVAWLAQGDLILDTIENFLAGGGCTAWGIDGVPRIWAGLTQVVFKVQWVMTAAEVRLGAMQAGLPLPLGGA